MALWMVDLETAASRERYQEYLKKRDDWAMSLKPAKNAEDRAIMLAGGPKMPHGDTPERDRIVSIQCRKLSDLEPGQVAPLHVFREWENPQGEKGILQQFADLTGYYKNKWSAILVGFNLDFDKGFLWKRGMAYGHVPFMSSPLDFERPCIDLFHWALLANADARRPPDARGNVPNLFYGASLSNFSAKTGKGSSVTELYHQRRYKEIDAYTRQEADAFLSLFTTLVETLPDHWRNVVAPRIGKVPGEAKKATFLIPQSPHQMGDKA